MSGPQSNPLGWPDWAWRCVVAFALAMAIYTVIGSFANLARAGGLLRDSGDPGVAFAAPQPAGTPNGWRRVETVARGGPADAAGIRGGDLVKFDDVLSPILLNQLNGPQEMTVDRNGHRFRTAITVRRGLPAPNPGLLALVGLGTLLTTVLGAVLLLRSRSNHTAAMLGAILTYLGMSNLLVRTWASDPTLAHVLLPLLLASDVFMAWFWPLFALEVSGGASSKGQARLVHGVSLAFAVLAVGAHVQLLTPVHVPGLGMPWLVLLILNQLSGYAIIARNYRRNDASVRNRIKIVVVAFVCYLIASAFRVTAALGSPDFALLLQYVYLVPYYGALALLVYGVLSRNLFDLNFALNRTLVYGVVSFVLLAAFGLAEWGVEQLHLIPEEWHEGGTFVSAGIALALFLSFHRLRDWVERHVERLLFRDWHENEAALRRFVGAAGHFDTTDALCRAFATEIGRFVHGAGVALYLGRADGTYSLCAGKLAGARKDVAADDRAFALMRAEREPVHLEKAHSALPGVLALPMLDQGKLTGFVLLARKPDGTDYRPDEVEVLGWAAHQIGLDLQAMHARELETEVANLGARLAMMSKERDQLRNLLARV